MSYIEIQNVYFSYDEENNVLEDVSFSIAEGESISIVGQNDAGKTTLVKLLNGLLKPTHGDVFIDDNNTKDYTTAQLSKYVGYVFQNPDDQIFQDKVYDEIAYAPREANYEEEKVDEIVQESAGICGLSELLDENPYDLPYSMRKFVAIASILALNPKVLILDEPTAGQDKKGMGIVSNIINYLVDNNKSIITITHDMEFTVDNFNRTIVMANSRKLADDTPSNIFWMKDVLNEAQLKQPYVSRVARKSKLQTENIVTVKNIIKAIKNKKEHSING